MPYINRDKRRILDPYIDQLHQALVDLETDDELNNMEGNVNYIVTRLLIMVYGDKTSTSYSNINDAMGVLASVGAEYYRKVAAPYEDQKEFDNGHIERFVGPLEVVGHVDITPEMVERVVKELNELAEEQGLFTEPQTALQKAAALTKEKFRHFNEIMGKDDDE